MFILENGATLSNVIIGKSQAEGVHCKGTCTLNNVWWADVCEDAATFKQGSGTSYVRGGGAFKASDKIFQFNGRGTIVIDNFYANDYGKLVRSCGNCKDNGGPRSEFFPSFFFLLVSFHLPFCAFLLCLCLFQSSIQQGRMQKDFDSDFFFSLTSAGLFLPL